MTPRDGRQWTYTRFMLRSTDSAKQVFSFLHGIVLHIPKSSPTFMFFGEGPGYFIELLGFCEMVFSVGFCVSGVKLVWLGFSAFSSFPAMHASHGRNPASSFIDPY